MRHFLVPLLFAAQLGAFPAVAQPAQDGQVTIHVPVADLDLQSGVGARTALVRIHKAATAICGEEPDAHNLERQALLQACTRDVVNQAVAEARSPVLAALSGAPAAGATRIAAR